MERTYIIVSWSMMLHDFDNTIIIAHSVREAYEKFCLKRKGCTDIVNIIDLGPSKLDLGE